MPDWLVTPSHRRQIAFTLLSLCSSLLLLLLFPGFNLRWLAPVALTPLLYVMARTSSPLQRFLLGWLAGCCFWFFICIWIQFVLQVHGGMGKWGGWATFVLFAVLKGLHLGVFGVVSGPLFRWRYGLLAVPALWTGLERTHATFGFAWLDLGNAGIDMALPLRTAPFVGVYGLSFLLAMMAAALAFLLLQRPRRELLPLLLLAVVFVLPPLPEQLPAPDRALIVQPNIDPELQWTPLLQSQVESRLTDLSNALSSPLVIWPEMPAPLYFYNDRDFHDDAVAIAKRHGSFLFGTVAYTSNNHPLNSAVLLNAEGEEAGRYDKIDLVPFGEYVPPLFGWVNRITDEVSDFVPGHDIRVLPNGAHRLGVFICYESAFPDLVRQFCKRGADVLVNLSNDGYFGHTAAREQHLLLVRMRAVENRRFVIRSTNDGITAVIDPAGRVRRKLPLYQEVAASVHYGGVTESTFYSRHGDWFAWLCLAFSLLCSLFLSVSPKWKKSGSVTRRQING